MLCHERTLHSYGGTSQRPTVLLAVRDPGLAAQLETWLVRDGILPVVATGTRAQDAARLLRFNAVVLERAPGCSALWNTLGTLPGTYRAAMLVVADDSDDPHSLFQLGAAAVLRRPLDRRTLTAHILDAVGDREASVLDTDGPHRDL